jgi:hypothetical protein
VSGLGQSKYDLPPKEKAYVIYEEGNERRYYDESLNIVNVQYEGMQSFLNEGKDRIKKFLAKKCIAMVADSKVSLQISCGAESLRLASVQQEGKTLYLPSQHAFFYAWLQQAMYSGSYYLESMVNHKNGTLMIFKD